MTIKSPPHLTPLQARMARAGLQWDLKELAKRAGVGHSTAHRFETGERRPIQAIQMAIRNAFEDAGVEFHGTTGVNIPDTRD